ncbi:MAG: hypothetical protein GX951_01985 [Mollicutes bacterium]|nr:hypothetical protein [Mollicutes bacterium]
MKIDLNELNYKDKIEVNEMFSYEEEYLKLSNIIKLDNVKVKGYIYQNEAEEYLSKVLVKGTLILPDSITLEPIEKPFEIKLDEVIDEVVENNQNTLDLKEYLWENIVLEVPIRFTKSDAKNLKGNNWQVIEENYIDPRLEKLKELYKGGE